MFSPGYKHSIQQSQPFFFEEEKLPNKSPCLHLDNRYCNLAPDLSEQESTWG